MQYYIAINNQQLGPFPEEQLVANGMTANTLVWTQGMAQWLPASQVPELATYLTGGYSGYGEATQALGNNYGRQQGYGSGYGQQQAFGNGYGQQQGYGSGYGQQQQSYGSGYGQQQSFGSNYNQPSSGYGSYNQPQYGYKQQPEGERPYNWLVPAIISIFVGNLIFGLIAMNCARKVNSYWDEGDYPHARGNAKAARILTIIAYVIGVFQLIFVISAYS